MKKYGHSYIPVLGIFLLFILPGFSEGAVALDVSFDVLPSAEGWTYVGGSAAVSETDTMTVSNGTLIYNTVPQDFWTYGYYLKENLDWEQAFSLSFRVKVIQSSQTWPLNPANGLDPFGCGVGFGNGQLSGVWGVASDYVACLDTNGNYVSSPLIGGIDNFSDFHDYTIEGSFADGTWSMYRDGQFIGSGMFGSIYTENSMWFGDGTTGANAYAVWESVSVESIPEPATLSLLALGAATLLRKRK